jgi:hypothetical protein
VIHFPEHEIKLLTGLLAQLVRALPCHGRGRGFKSHTDRKNWGPRKFGQNGHLRNYIINLRKFNYEGLAFFADFL